MPIDIKPAVVLEGATFDVQELREAIKGRKDDEWLIVGEPDRYRALLIKEMKPVLKSYVGVARIRLKDEAGFDPWIDSDAKSVDIETEFRNSAVANGRLIVGTDQDLSVASSGTTGTLSAGSIFDTPDIVLPGQIDPHACSKYPTHKFRDDGSGGRVCDVCGYRPRS